MCNDNFGINKNELEHICGYDIDKNGTIFPITKKMILESIKENNQCTTADNNRIFGVITKISGSDVYVSLETGEEKIFNINEIAYKVYTDFYSLAGNLYAPF